VESACVAGAAADQGLAEGSCARRFIGAAEETSRVKVERRVESRENMKITSRGLAWPLELKCMTISRPDGSGDGRRGLRPFLSKGF